MATQKSLWVRVVFISALICLFGLLKAGGAAGKDTKPGKTIRAGQEQTATYFRLPLSFEANQGQTDPRVKFLSRGGGYTLFLTGSEAVLSLKKPSAVSSQPTHNRNPKLKSRIPSPERSAPAVLLMELAGANPAARITGLEELPGKTNYFLGKDPKKWRTNVPTYAKVKYASVYPGVDLVYYGAERELEYDFVVAPGADPKAITLGIKTGNSKAGTALRIDGDGDLVIPAEGGEVRFHKPVVYQTANPRSQIQDRKSVIGRYVLLADNRIGFEVPNYDKTLPLVIDPVLSYSSYLGGSGVEPSWGPGIAVDSSGNAYVTGKTLSADFPVTAGAAQPSYRGPQGCTSPSGRCGDAFITKINAAGSALVYSTYLGGSDHDEGLTIAVDASGNAYVAGGTMSQDFPTTAGAFQTTFGGMPAACEGGPACGDAFVTKLNASGSALVYSTYLGGSDMDSAWGIALDASENAYVAGTTSSANFPTTPKAFQPSFTPNFCVPLCPDVFVTKLNGTGTGLVYSTFLGGSGGEWASGIAVNSSGEAYVTGYTPSSDFPVTKSAFQKELKPGSNPFWSPDAFMAKLNSHGSKLLYSTFLGGSGGSDECDCFLSRIAVDSTGNAYVAGTTLSTDFPTTPGAYQTAFGGGSGGTDVFVSKIDPSKTGAASLVYSTYLGANCGAWALGMAVDAAGNAYVSSLTVDPNFPLVKPLQGFKSGDVDAFVVELNATGSALVYSTYLGGGAFDLGAAVAVDPWGNAYVFGPTASSDFPTTSGVFQPGFGGGVPGEFWWGQDYFLVKIAPIDAPGVSLSKDALVFGYQRVRTTSPPQAVILRNVGSAPLLISNITATGDFAQTNDCGGSLAGGSYCTISVTFSPSRARDVIQGVLTIEDNAFSGGSQQVTLTGQSKR
ncbi:MAG: SBBP repeat-containing protein [Acidobacteria bacterium]|nr:SBBP repeat-containing protein [Acidobacteriota bacterium]